MQFLRIALRSFQTASYILSTNTKSKSAKSVISFLSKNDTPSLTKKSKEIPLWKRRDETTKRKIKGERWNPKKKLSKESMEKVRLLKEQMPHLNSGDLSKHFELSPEAIRRILKSKWRPNEEENEDIQRRWKKRGEMIKQKYDKKVDPNSDIEIPVSRRLRLNYNSRQDFMEITAIKRPKNAHSAKNFTVNNKLSLLNKITSSNS